MTLHEHEVKRTMCSLVHVQQLAMPHLIRQGRMKPNKQNSELTGMHACGHQANARVLVVPTAV